MLACSLSTSLPTIRVAFAPGVEVGVGDTVQAIGHAINVSEAIRKTRFCRQVDIPNVITQPSTAFKGVFLSARHSRYSTTCAPAVSLGCIIDDARLHKVSSLETQQCWHSALGFADSRLQGSEAILIHTGHPEEWGNGHGASRRPSLIINPRRHFCALQMAKERTRPSFLAAGLAAIRVVWTVGIGQ
jgi:hypothetical protein